MVAAATIGAAAIGGAVSSNSASKANKSQRKIADRQSDLAEAQWQSYLDVYEPISRQLGAELSQPSANAMEMAGGRAAADVTQSYGLSADTFKRNAARFGINPNSGKFLSGLASLNSNKAADTAGAINTARMSEKNRRTGLMLDFAGQGRGLPASASQGLATASAGFGNVARTNANAANSAFQAAGYYAQPFMNGLTTPNTAPQTAPAVSYAGTNTTTQAGIQEIPF